MQDDATRTVADPRRLPAGSRISRYVLQRFLGAGGMGQVYAATDDQLGRLVAIKLLPSGTNPNSTWVERFTREARAASALNHPNIVTVHETGECDVGRYIVMEMVEGRTLRQRIAEGLSSEDALEFGAQIAKAVAVAHSAGIIHRDIKPDNIMVREDGYVKVLDFGLALLPAEISEAHSVTGLVVGTARYMSPEQGQGLPLGTPSDVFSLGVVTYEMLTGQHPFGSAAAFRTLTGQPLPPSSLDPGIPGALDDLILAMLHVEPEQRPPASRVARVLHDLRNGVALPVQRPGGAAGKKSGKAVGREKEFARLAAAADIPATGQGLLVCISGEAGLGKSTLVEDFLGGLLRDVPRLIGRGRCSQLAAGAEAHLPVLGALENLIASDPTGFAARTMRLLAPTWYSRVARSDASAMAAAAEAAGSPERLKRELLVLFQALAKQSRLIVVFEDVHWADDATIDVMSYISSQFDQLGLLLIATLRESEVLQRKHPFQRLKLDLQARRRCQEITLGFLSATEVARYVALEFPENGFPSDFAGRIHARTQGHPLFLADVLRYLKDRGAVMQENGLWVLSPEFARTETELPESVRSMVQRKMEFITEEERRLLGAASVQGYQFDSAVLAKVLEWDPLEVEERLEKLETVDYFVKAGAEHDMPDGTLSCRYEFIHNLYQIAFYETLRPTRRSVLSGATARALLDYYGARSSKIAMRLAPLLAVAREWEQAGRYYFLASTSAAYLFALTEAATLARRGIEATNKMPPSLERSRLELGLQLALGRPLALSGGASQPEAMACFARASELAREMGDDVEAFPVIFGLYVVSAMAGQSGQALLYGQQMLGIAVKSGDPIALAQAHHATAFALETVGDPEGAERHVRQVLAGEHRSNAEYVANYNVDPVIGSEWIHARLLWMKGLPDQAKDQVWATLRRIDQQETDLRSACYTFMIACLVHQFRGDAPDVLALAARGNQFCQKHGFEVEPRWFAFLEGWAQFSTGQAAEGLAKMRASMEFLKASGVLMFANPYAAVFADTLVRQGELEEAARWIAWAQEFSERSGYGHWRPELERISAEIFAARGQADEAQAGFDRAMQLARSQGARSFELRTAISLARFWQAQGKRDEGLALLENLCAQFSEGLETADLTAARALLAFAAGPPP